MKTKQQLLKEAAALQQQLKRVNEEIDVLEKKQMQKLAGVPSKQEVYYDDIHFLVQAKYPNIRDAVQGIKQYLASGKGPITFDQWYKSEASTLPPFGSGAILHLVDRNEKPGKQPPLVVAANDPDLITDPEEVAALKQEDGIK